MGRDIDVRLQKALTYKLTFENKALSLKTETHASKDEIRRLAQNMQPAGGKGQVTRDLPLVSCAAM